MAFKLIYQTEHEEKSIPSPAFVFRMQEQGICILYTQKCVPVRVHKYSRIFCCSSLLLLMLLLLCL